MGGLGKDMIFQYSQINIRVPLIMFPAVIILRMACLVALSLI